MIATIILGIFSVLSAFLARYTNTRWGLKLSFILIFLFLALRYNFGNDYDNYLNVFNEIKQYNDVNSLYLMMLRFEPAWLFLNWCSRHLVFLRDATLAALNLCLLPLY